MGSILSVLITWGRLSCLPTSVYFARGTIPCNYSRISDKDFIIQYCNYYYHKAILSCMWQIYANLSKWLLDKFMQFLFMHSSRFMHCNVWHDKYLCDQHLTPIIGIKSINFMHEDVAYGILLLLLLLLWINGLSLCEPSPVKVTLCNYLWHDDWKQSLSGEKMQLHS